ncbi:MAG: carboxymuconolactone decarboxylase family protein [Candidatus Dormibacteraeota bacterium]|nr:carboxymuconolactone decarboxylase family protein [Candidatus Dormibacteraeota bacterium]
MALVKLVDESEATGLVKEVYDDILRSRNLARVPNYWKALAHRPEYLRDTWTKLKDVMSEGSLDRRTKEIIAVAVSATNNCSYCLSSHTDALRAMGFTDSDLVELMAVVDFFNGSNAVASGLKVEYEPPVPAAGKPSDDQE